MTKFKAILFSFILLITLQSCYDKYPEELITGTFKTTTELNTVKYMYRDKNYRYIYSDEHPYGNKLAKITWHGLGYKLETINKVNKYDSLVQTIVLDEVKSTNSFIETTYTEGIELKFSSEWIRIDESPEAKLLDVLKENGIE
tara:strand:+ start:107 stop:535 length:429 start_codon:yes stop_codon:yes gene_type:complete